MRETYNLNFGWRFHEGDDVKWNHNAIHKDRFTRPQWLKAGNLGAAFPDYPDDDWEEVQLPHDFILLRGDFRSEHNVVNGSLGTGTGWYRRLFKLPGEDESRRIHLEFDGIMRDSRVWLNGHLMDRVLSGYESFSLDITDYCVFGGLNAVTVRCAAEEPELWSYEGGGIYRNVRLVKTSPLFVPAWGTYIRCEESGKDTALVRCTTEIRNAGGTEKSVKVLSRIVDPDGNAVTEDAVSVQVPFMETAEAEQELTVSAARLWSPDTPELYRMITEIRSGDDKLLDTFESAFGIRFIRFNAEEGFFLNGEPVKIKGVCCHQDHAGVGAALPDALQDWRIERLKSMGCNGYRASHNPASPALLDACDRLGMLVMDENRLLGTSPEYEKQLKAMIRRGRNHPSVILWSLGNEEMNVQHTKEGIRIMSRMQDLIHKMDPSRPVTYAMNCDWISIVDEHEKEGFELDVFGANYTCGCRNDVYDEFHKKYPSRCFLGSETGGSASTRGLYEREYTPAPAEISPFNEKVLVWSNPKREGIVSAYSETFTAWGRSIMDTWKDCADRPFVAGTFLWTGFDYRGETFPYLFPSVVTRYGIMDLCGIPKDAYWYYRAWWQNEPVLHLLPHWDWQGHEGKDIEVWCYSNAAEVELMLNGCSVGRRTMEPNGYLAWEVPWEAGELKAVGYGADGAVIKSCSVSTSGAAHHLRADAQRLSLTADGEDLVPVTVSLRDESGQVLPRSDAPVYFSVEGPLKIPGVGNGNPVSHEPDRSDRRRCYHGWCQVLVQSAGTAGTGRLIASSPGVGSACVEIDVSGVPRRPAFPVASVKRDALASGSPRSDVDAGL